MPAIVALLPLWVLYKIVSFVARNVLGEAQRRGHYTPPTYQPEPTPDPRTSQPPPLDGNWLPPPGPYR